MNVENIVKVMNFHALLRVNEARNRVEQAHNYEKEIKYMISNIVTNRIFKQENISLDLPTDAPELNIYMGSDMGFCASFNSDVLSFLKEDKPENHKIIIGRRIVYDTPNIILKISKDDFTKNFGLVYNKILSGIFQKLYSKINIIYVHYYNLSKQKIIKRTLLPFDYELDDLDRDEGVTFRNDEDYVVEGDLQLIIWDLISFYIITEIRVAEAWSWASENVQRQSFTNESLHKIEEKNEEKLRRKRKEKRTKEFKTIIEINNKKIKNEEE